MVRLWRQWDVSLMASRVRIHLAVVCFLVLSGVVANAIASVTVAAQTATPEENRSGRLGGSLSEIREANGEPDWVDAGLVGYNSIRLAGVDTIVVVYHDAEETVFSLSLVYLEKPETFDDESLIADVVAGVAPLDGECETEPLDASGLGTQVYACASESLEGLFTPEELEAFGVKGEDGSYSYSVDPTLDDYYEIIVQFGTDSTVPPPTPVPTTAPEPTAAPSLTDIYPPVLDVRELAIGRGYSEGDPLSISGTVQTIFVDGDYTQLQISVAAPDGSDEWVIIGYGEDSSGIFEGTWVTVYGNYFGKECFTNTLGGEVCQPAILAVQIDR
jgi:hypothetical protein